MVWSAILAVTLGLAALEADADEGVTVVANQSVVQESIDRSTLRAIFGMRLRKWPSGGPTTVFVLPDQHPVHARFAKQVLNVYPHQLRRWWDRLVYSGTGQAPIEVEDQAEMLERVAQTPGGVGYTTRRLTDVRLHALEVR